MEELKVRGTEGTCQENFDTCHVEYFSAFVIFYFTKGKLGECPVLLRISNIMSSKFFKITFPTLK